MARRAYWLGRKKTPASRHIHGAQLSETGLIAMQKVVGSNPISRFDRNPALQRDFVVQAGRSENQTTPAYRLHFGH
jgi:hypothetical protein